MALINYYAREGFRRQVQTVCADALSKRGEDPVFRFWRAWSHEAEGSPNEALREYKLAEGKREMAYAVDTAMLYTHRRCKLIDQEAVDTLDARLAVDEVCAPCGTWAMRSVSLDCTPTPPPQVSAGVGKPPHGLGVCVWMPLDNGTGNSPVFGTADPRSSQTGQVIRGLR